MAGKEVPFEQTQVVGPVYTTSLLFCILSLKPTAVPQTSAIHKALCKTQPEKQEFY